LQGLRRTSGIVAGAEIESVSPHCAARAQIFARSGAAVSGSLSRSETALARTSVEFGIAMPEKANFAFRRRFGILDIAGLD
jgi:hypothetical protein